jgi:hypothetical protein
MSSSLKGLIPALARRIGTSPAALYERQRALIRVGLLAAEAGRGPGSGVRATSPAVALLLIAVLATDNLSETDDRIRGLMDAAPVRGKRCPLTRMPTFLDAMAAILLSKNLSRRVINVTVSRNDGTARVGFTIGGKEVASEFRSKGSERKAGLRVEASFDRDTIALIADDVISIAIGET